VPYAAENFTMSNGVRLSFVPPPIVPLIPEMLFINAILYTKFRESKDKKQFIVCLLQHEANYKNIEQKTVNR
jgi:hypothetical protein